MLTATPTTLAGAVGAGRAFGAVVTQPSNLQLLLQGLWVTIKLAAFSLILALALGVVFGVLRTVPLRPLRAAGTAYVEFFRNTPLLVQMYYWYFGLPVLAGVTLPGFQAAFLALGIYTGAFVAEVVRAGILAVSPGHLEAARSLGLSYLQTVRHVVLPQAFATTVPPLGNLAIAMTKNTSVASAIAVQDVMYNGNLLNSRTFATYEVFASVGLAYLSLTVPLSVLVNRLERRLTRFRR
ncbi:MAG TPA: amino acid ABC transporter permease [Chloroflexota bacterium]|nr:amino acid ABC transporter permease [Chloroflexota bacterium]